MMNIRIRRACRDTLDVQCCPQQAHTPRHTHACNNYGRCRLVRLRFWSVVWFLSQATVSASYSTFQQKLVLHFGDVRLI
jgi:hypothetical protein